MPVYVATLLWICPSFLRFSFSHSLEPNPRCLPVSFSCMQWMHEDRRGNVWLQRATETLYRPEQSSQTAQDLGQPASRMEGWEDTNKKRETEIWGGERWHRYKNVENHWMMEGEKKGVAEVMSIRHRAKKRKRTGQKEQWPDMRRDSIRCLFVVSPQKHCYQNVKNYILSVGLSPNIN